MSIQVMLLVIDRRRVSVRDGNFIRGSGYPWIPDPVGQGYGAHFCPWVHGYGYPRTAGLGMVIVCASWISNGYPYDMWGHMPVIVERANQWVMAGNMQLVPNGRKYATCAISYMLQNQPLVSHLRTHRITCCLLMHVAYVVICE